MHDVVIIGAGPGGLMAARALAEQHHDVVVLEEHPVVGCPIHCTGVLGMDAFDELDLPRDTIRAVARSACFSSATGRSVIIESDRVEAAVVDRGAFDQALARRALSAGAALLTGTRVERLEVGARAVVAHVAGGRPPIAARASVLACGASYRFHRALGLGVPRAFLQTAQLETAFPRKPHVEVRFGQEIAPGGFAWLVPFQSGGDDRARIGLMCDTRARQRLQEFLELVARQSGVDPGAWPAPRLKILPLGPVQKTYAPRLLAVGDAAGLVKPTTGGGIYYSLLSGALAADTLDEALRRDDLMDQRSLAAYEQRWRKRLGPDIRAGLTFRSIAARLDDRAFEALIELARVNGLVPLLKRTANFNWHRRAALALLRNSSFRRIALNSLWR